MVAQKKLDVRYQCVPRDTFSNKVVDNDLFIKVRHVEIFMKLRFFLNFLRTKTTTGKMFWIGINHL